MCVILRWAERHPPRVFPLILPVPVHLLSHLAQRGGGVYASHTQPPTCSNKQKITTKVLLPFNASLNKFRNSFQLIKTMKTSNAEMLARAIAPLTDVTTAITLCPRPPPPPSYAPPGILRRGWCWRWCCQCCAAGSWSSPPPCPQSGSV